MDAFASRLRKPVPFEDIFSARNQKIGRNDPCPCNSGLKYKKCHGASVPGDSGDEIGVAANKPRTPKGGSRSAAAIADPDSAN